MTLDNDGLEMLKHRAMCYNILSQNFIVKQLKIKQKLLMDKVKKLKNQG